MPRPKTKFKCHKCEKLTKYVDAYMLDGNFYCESCYLDVVPQSDIDLIIEDLYASDGLETAD